MPITLNIDWDKAKSLYIKGVPLSEIACNMSCSYVALRARAYRYGWKQDAAEASRALQRVVATNLAGKGESWANRIATVIEGLLAHIESLEPSERDVDELEKLVRVLKSLDDVGRRTFRLDEAQASTTKLVSGPVIDVSYPAPARLPESTSPDPTQDKPSA